MINKIIARPKIIGCLNCSPVPNIELKEDEEVSPYGIVSLKISGEREKWFYDGIYKQEPLSVKRIMKKWGKYIKKSHHTLLNICGFTHMETYEYDKKTDKWYLVQQGRGMA